jgi:two-component system OmpR family response regulator
MQKKILFIDDEIEITTQISEMLSRHDFQVFTANCADEAHKQLTAHSPDLILLDLQLPGKSGLDLCRELRSISNIPIIIVSASGQLVDKVLGLELGADDYIQKPFEFKELLARVRALFRRYDQTSIPENQSSEILRSQGLILDLTRSNAELNGASLELTNMEFEILSLLMKNPGVTFSREQLVEKIRGMEWDSVDRTVDVIVSRIRTKLQEDAKHPKYLKTIWGSGYRFVGKMA